MPNNLQDIDFGAIDRRINESGVFPFDPAEPPAADFDSFWGGDLDEMWEASRGLDDLESAVVSSPFYGETPDYLRPPQVNAALRTYVAYYGGEKRAQKLLKADPRRGGAEDYAKGVLQDDLDYSYIDAVREWFGGEVQRWGIEYAMARAREMQKEMRDDPDWQGVIPDAEIEKLGRDLRYAEGEGALEWKQRRARLLEFKDRALGGNWGYLNPKRWLVGAGAFVAHPNYNVELGASLAGGAAMQALLKTGQGVNAAIQAGNKFFSLPVGKVAAKSAGGTGLIEAGAVSIAEIERLKTRRDYLRAAMASQEEIDNEFINSVVNVGLGALFGAGADALMTAGGYAISKNWGKLAKFDAAERAERAKADAALRARQQKDNPPPSEPAKPKPQKFVVNKYAAGQIGGAIEYTRVKAKGKNTQEIELENPAKWQREDFNGTFDTLLIRQRAAYRDGGHDGAVEVDADGNEVNGGRVLVWNMEMIDPPAKEKTEAEVKATADKAGEVFPKNPPPEVASAPVTPIVETASNAPDGSQGAFSVDNGGKPLSPDDEAALVVANGMWQAQRLLQADGTMPPPSMFFEGRGGRVVFQEDVPEVIRDIMMGAYAHGDVGGLELKFGDWQTRGAVDWDNVRWARALKREEQIAEIPPQEAQRAADESQPQKAADDTDAKFRAKYQKQIDRFTEPVARRVAEDYGNKAGEVFDVLEAWAGDGRLPVMREADWDLLRWAMKRNANTAARLATYKNMYNLAGELPYGFFIEKPDSEKVKAVRLLKEHSPEDAVDILLNRGKGAKVKPNGEVEVENKAGQKTKSSLVALKTQDDRWVLARQDQKPISINIKSFREGGAVRRRGMPKGLSEKYWKLRPNPLYRNLKDIGGLRGVEKSGAMVKNAKGKFEKPWGLPAEMRGELDEYEERLKNMGLLHHPDSGRGEIIERDWLHTERYLKLIPDDEVEEGRELEAFAKALTGYYPEERATIREFLSFEPKESDRLVGSRLMAIRRGINPKDAEKWQIAEAEAEYPNAVARLEANRQKLAADDDGYWSDWITKHIDDLRSVLRGWGYDVLDEPVYATREPLTDWDGNPVFENGEPVIEVFGENRPATFSPDDKVLDLAKSEAMDAVWLKFAQRDVGDISVDADGKLSGGVDEFLRAEYITKADEKEADNFAMHFDLDGDKMDIRYSPRAMGYLITRIGSLDAYKFLSESRQGGGDMIGALNRRVVDEIKAARGTAKKAAVLESQSPPPRRHADDVAEKISKDNQVNTAPLKMAHLSTPDGNPITMNDTGTLWNNGTNSVAVFGKGDGGKAKLVKVVENTGDASLTEDAKAGVRAVDAEKVKKQEAAKPKAAGTVNVRIWGAASQSQRAGLGMRGKIAPDNAPDDKVSVISISNPYYARQNEVIAFQDKSVGHLWGELRQGEGYGGIITVDSQGRQMPDQYAKSFDSSGGLVDTGRPPDATKISDNGVVSLYKRTRDGNFVDYVVTRGVVMRDGADTEWSRIAKFDDIDSAEAQAREWQPKDTPPPQETSPLLSGGEGDGDRFVVIAENDASGVSFVYDKDDGVFVVDTPKEMETFADGYEATKFWGNREGIPEAEQNATANRALECAKLGGKR